MGFTKHVVIIIIINVICYDTFFWLTSLPLNNIFLFGWGWFASSFFSVSTSVDVSAFAISSPFFGFHPLVLPFTTSSISVSKYCCYFFVSVLFFFVDSMHFLLFWLSTHLPSVFLCHFFFPYLLSLFLQLM